MKDKRKNPFMENVIDRIMLLPVLRLFYPAYKDAQARAKKTNKDETRHIR